MDDLKLNQEKVKKCKSIKHELDNVRTKVENIIVNSQEEIEEIVELNKEINTSLNRMKSLTE